MTVQGPVKKQQPDGLSHRGTTRRNVPQGGGGLYGGEGVSQSLCDVFVCSLFGVFEDLHGYLLGSAFADLSPSQRMTFPRKSQKC